jgi:hypothetical protein
MAIRDVSLTIFAASKLSGNDEAKISLVRLDYRQATGGERL